MTRQHTARHRLEGATSLLLLALSAGLLVAGVTLLHRGCTPPSAAPVWIEGRGRR